jgi:hypothetical protein
VKGLAGNLGIGPVYSAAERLERSLRNGDAAATALLQEFASAVRVAVDTIRDRLTQSAPETVPVSRRDPFDLEAALAATARLKSLLEANDGDAADALPGVLEALGGVVDQRRLGALRNEVANFDFAGALSTLAEITGVRALSAS